MQRRGLFAVLLALFMLGGMASVAAVSAQAASPAPIVSPPAQCFVEQNGALPTCEKLPDGSWSVTYPRGGGNLDGGSSGGHKGIALAVVIAAILGIVVIVWRTWLNPKPAGSADFGAGGSVGLTTSAPGDAGPSGYYAAPPVIQQPPPAEPPPSNQPPASQP